MIEIIYIIKGEDYPMKRFYRHRAITLALLAGISLLLIACGGSSASIRVGEPAPDFTLTDALTGQEVSLSDYAGQPVLLFFHMAQG